MFQKFMCESNWRRSASDPIEANRRLFTIVTMFILAVVSIYMVFAR
jgi:hypothetical protein